MTYRFDFGAVLDRAPELLWGSIGTLGLALAGMLLALVIGILGVVARTSKSEIMRTPVIVFVEVVRNTPVVRLRIRPISSETRGLPTNSSLRCERTRWTPSR